MAYIARNRFAQRIDVDAEVCIGFNTLYIFFADPERDCRFFGRAVCFIGCVNAKTRQIAIDQTKLSRGWRGLFARGRERVHDSN